MCLEGVSCVFDHIWGGHPDGFQPLQGAMYIYAGWYEREGNILYVYIYMYVSKWVAPLLTTMAHGSLLNSYLKKQAFL